MPRKLISMVILFYLNACANITAKSTPMPQDQIALAPPINPARHLEQKITAMWPGRQEQFIVVMELDKHHIALAGMTPDGMSLFNLNYDGQQTLIEKSPMLPPNFFPELIIRDIQMAYWPLDELYKALGTHWRIQNSPKQRFVYRDNVLQYEITYSRPGNIWTGNVSLSHLSEHYRLQISTIQYEAVPE